MKRMSIDAVDKLTGTGFAVIGVAAIAEAVRLYPYRSGAWAGDHTAPALLGAILLLLGLVTVFRKRKRSPVVKLPSRRDALHMLYAFAVLSGYCITLPVIGYSAVTPLAAAFLFWILGVNIRLPAGMRTAAVLFWSLLTTALLDLVFGVWLGLSLPDGLWGSF